MPRTGDLPSRESVYTEQRAQMDRTEMVPVTTVPVTRGMLVVKSIRGDLPAEVGKRQFSVSFPGSENTLERLTTMIGFSGLRVAHRFETAADRDMLAKPLPFRSFSGSLAEMTAVLKAGVGIVSWWQDNTLFLADQDRFAFTVPQNEDVIGAIAADLKGFGAKDITSSLRGGQIVFSAPPSLYREVIEPYINRMQRNMAMVTVQLAVVTLGINDNSANGFDWAQFTAQFVGNNAALAIPGGSGAQGASSTSQAASGVTGAGASLPQLGMTVSQAGKLLGFQGVFNVASAISYLSRFGETNTRQNLEVRTLSGAQVTLRSGQKVPYVSGVGVNALAGSGGVAGAGIVGSAQTSSVPTGLTIKMTPFYDADNRVVTVDLNVQVNSVLEFRELSAGSQVGTFSQPVTQEQSLNDIVRVLAGNTVVIGGLQTDSSAFTGLDPTLLRTGAASSPSPIGHRSQNIQKQAVFIILRPSVTVFQEQAS